ncbi:phage minor head protein [Lentilactobacillus buchneri]|uniref:Phage head morphogenesis domain-containing protein n=1 Tax=Lentilactobacillus buchneri DSM 20057 TaxID=1423728 RepID=A0A4R5NPU5_LENBU|nr:phage minor head protein [Lentilactobacillus buchneri]MCT3253460.1 hypothetical protein [Lentilactobacillus buchneri]MCT3548052.1 hypothetical protein [Lentilactobacillus buchneri]MCT4438520.1 hypothetical protein [Lentilactobacillus buchneri]MQM69561.1 hypothetical protein [Lentilactobacillus buchneri]QUX05608.1 hypothetical protein KE627_00105 [Lentilactobacillus buchneri]
MEYVTENDLLNENPDLYNSTVGFISDYVNKHFPNINADKRKMIKSATLEGIFSGSKTIGKTLENIFGYHSNLYQMTLDLQGRPLAFMTRYKIIAAGAKYYYWRTVEDTKVRARHKKLNGKRFAILPKYATKKCPYLQIYPGSEHSCRCFMEGIFNV